MGKETVEIMGGADSEGVERCVCLKGIYVCVGGKGFSETRGGIHDMNGMGHQVSFEKCTVSRLNQRTAPRLCGHVNSCTNHIDRSGCAPFILSCLYIQ